jgi:hypothetical protein
MAVASLFSVLHAELPDSVVVTAAAPLDSQRLADALRTYLDEFGIHVQVAPATTDGDLRTQLDDARHLGESVRAVAVVRAERETRGEIEVELYDLATDKALVAVVRRPVRDEDLYRALALKIQAILRATFSEARGEVQPGSPVGRLLAANGTAPATPAGRPGAEPAAATVSAPDSIALEYPDRQARPATHLALATGYAIVSFPVGGLVLQGVEVNGVVLPRPWLELTLGTAVLGSVHAAGGGVDAVMSVIPVSAAALLRLTRGRTELLFGPSAELAFASVSPTSTTSVTLPVVPSTHNVIVGLGGEAEGRLRAWETTWIFARVSALGVLLGERYDVSGAPILDTSRFELSAVAGIGVALR